MSKYHFFIVEELFPDIDEKVIYDLIIEQNLMKEEIVEYLLSNTPESNYLPWILSKHALKVMEIEDDLSIKTNRACMWNKAKALYKNALHNKTMLKQKIMVEFSGEEGVDAGALKNDFYEECLRQADKQFFQGKEETAMLPLGH